MKFPLSTAWIVLFLFSSEAASLEPYAVIEHLLDKNQLPRLLNTEDIPHMDTHNPAALTNPIGDFNGDGVEDIAISGRYTLPKGKQFFLLVASAAKNKYKFNNLFFQEYNTPVYLHERGTTGESDPNDQAFSLTFCSDCETGFDFYWNKDLKKFDQVDWKIYRERTQSSIRLPAEEIPDLFIDQSLRIVGALADVQKFVKTVQEKKGRLVTRVFKYEEDTKNRFFWVEITEEEGNVITTYDKIMVDLKKKRIVKRTTDPK